jgi:hypothetical protein
MSGRTSVLPLLQRTDVCLGVILGSIGGILLGFFLGYFLGGDASSERPDLTALAQTEASSKISRHSVERTTATPSPRNWLKQSAAQFEDAPEIGPAPGLNQAFMEALQAEPPFDQARLLMLIEMMRKEDFPALLEVMRRAKTSLHSSSVGMQGPAIWMAFWKRFGELDPKTALATALTCGDLTYTNRKYLEKHLFAGMARTNASAAAEAFLAHPELPDRNTAIEGLMEEWTKKDPKSALAWAQNLEGDLVKAAFYSAAWGASSNVDISGGDALLRGAPEGTAREAVISSLKSQIGQKPYLPAHQILEFIETTRELGARDPQFEAKIATRCAASDPYAAASFFSQPAAADAANDFKGLQIVASEWIRSDPEAAENWAKGKEGEPAYEIFAVQFLNAAQQRNDPAEVKRWTERIEGLRGSEPAL